MKRRQFLHLTSSSFLWPKLLQAGPLDEQLFLFVYVRGGWDPTFVFTNQIGNNNVYTQAGCYAAEANGIPYVAHPSRPSVDRFFQDFGDQTCVINGIEIESLTHDACQRILFTGQPSAGKDDWPSIIGSQSTQRLPVMVVSGPSYTVNYTNAVIRSGEDGQLSKLLNGSVHQQSDQPITTLSPDAQTRVQAFLNGRVASLSDEEAFARSLKQVYDQRQNSSVLSSLQLGSSTGFTPVPDQVAAAIPTLSEGLSRCLVIEHNGLYESGWDQHSSIDNQSDHFELLFSDLCNIVDSLNTWGGAAFAQRVTMVVFSEMGRAPTLNTLAGKDHWTYTSAMIISQNIQGGRTIGGFNTNLIGQRVDPLSGSIAESGARITANHLGAGLLQLADVDPSMFLPQTTPLLL